MTAPGSDSKPWAWSRSATVDNGALIPQGTFVPSPTEALLIRRLAPILPLAAVLLPLAGVLLPLAGVLLLPLAGVLLPLAGVLLPLGISGNVLGVRLHRCRRRLLELYLAE